jgi:hypothetical protein
MDKQEIENLHTPKLPKCRAGAALEHFAGMAEKLQAGDWESCIVKADKSVEAALKALLIHAGAGCLVAMNRIKPPGAA